MQISTNTSWLSDYDLYLLGEGTHSRAVPILRPADLQTINTGERSPQGAMAVVAPGTGLGESFLTWDGAGYRAHSSEGGHSDFAPTDDRQIHLLEYMFTKFEHLSTCVPELGFRMSIVNCAMLSRSQTIPTLPRSSILPMIHQSRLSSTSLMLRIQASCAWQPLICLFRFWPANRLTLQPKSWQLVACTFAVV